jgi:type II secretory pathway component PulM
MELFVAIWSLRLALLGSLLVGVVSISTGTQVLDAADRALVAAFAFTLLGRLLVGWLEPPEERKRRRRAQFESRRAPKGAAATRLAGAAATRPAGAASPANRRQMARPMTPR